MLTSNYQNFFGFPCLLKPGNTLVYLHPLSHHCGALLHPNVACRPVSSGPVEMLKLTNFGNITVYSIFFSTLVFYKELVDFLFKAMPQIGFQQIS
jgi:hypothetical protein